MTEEIKTAVVMAGSPSINAALYRRLRFSVVDSVVLIELDAGVRSVLILRDIEMERAARNAR
ncbi:MAG: hypothetical protein HOJ89_01225, partial [Opitutales bacterium]|nr:hypothetical protein [Opitutales bacterium]